MRRSAREVARVPRTNVAGLWERHVSATYAARALQGSAHGGRWGPANGFPVIYLGRPTVSVVVEAYRHLIDPFEGMRTDYLQPRVLISCQVDAKNVLDLRASEHRLQVGLTDDDILSAIGDHDACVQVGSIAHQLGCHGVIAPSATGLGETLALFPYHLSVDELPVAISRVQWETLPGDPRRPRLVRSVGVD